MRVPTFPQREPTEAHGAAYIDNTLLFYPQRTTRAFQRASQAPGRAAHQQNLRSLPIADTGPLVGLVRESRENDELSAYHHMKNLN